MTALYAKVQVKIGACDLSQFRYKSYFRNDGFRDRREVDDSLQSFPANGIVERTYDLNFWEKPEDSTVSFVIYSPQGDVLSQPFSIDLYENRNNPKIAYLDLHTSSCITAIQSNNTKQIRITRPNKQKFIILCGGRGMGHHNQGANFLNVAKYHIEEIKSNSFPNLPKFDNSTCEIISPEDLYKMGGYNIFTEDTMNKDGQPDGYKDKPVPTGEIHRISEFMRIFTEYRNIKYFAYFGHSWAWGTQDGGLLLGDRKGDTNIFKSTINSLNDSNIRQDAQFRFFGCRSAYETTGFKPVAELFAEKFPGRKCYGWPAHGGSIFTHDKDFGHSGINNTGIDPNTQSVDTNRRRAWLVANGKPKGWKVYEK